MAEEVRKDEENNNIQGIKLFGTTIKLHGVELKEGEKESKDRTVEKKSEKNVSCPRCKSMETKFCYFNNYNVNQPRHFCKGCQRYWTAGGALRNVPVGAGRRKVKLPGHEDSGSPDSCLYEASDDGDKWHVDTSTSQSDFRDVFSGKRQRVTSGGYPLALL